MLNLKSLLTKIVQNGIFKSGVTMTGQLKTSYNNFVACGGYDSSQTTIAGLINEVKMSSGVMGYFHLAADDSNYGATVYNGHYTFIYLPHRYGGVNGTTPTTTGETDNCKYGNLILFSMFRCYIINLNNNTITGAYLLGTHFFDYNATAISFTSISNSYYEFKTTNSWGTYIEGDYPHGVLLTLYFQCTTPQTSWQKIGSYSLPSNYTSSAGKVNQDYNFCLTNTAGTVIHGYINSSGEIFTKGGTAGHGFKGTIFPITF